MRKHQTWRNVRKEAAKEKKKRNYEEARKGKVKTQEEIKKQERDHYRAAADEKRRKEKDEKDKLKECQKNAVRPEIKTINIDNKSVTDIIIAIAEHAIAEHHKANKNKTSLAFEGTDDKKTKRFNILAELAKKQLESNTKLTIDILIPKLEEQLEELEQGIVKEEEEMAAKQETVTTEVEVETEAAPKNHLPLETDVVMGDRKADVKERIGPDRSITREKQTAKDAATTPTTTPAPAPAPAPTPTPAPNTKKRKRPVWIHGEAATDALNAAIKDENNQLKKTRCRTESKRHTNYTLAK